MRIRLMLDVDLDKTQIELLQKVIEVQLEATIAVEGFPALGARLMGAMPVEAEQ